MGYPFDDIEIRGAVRTSSPDRIEGIKVRTASGKEVELSVPSNWTLDYDNKKIVVTDSGSGGGTANFTGKVVTTSYTLLAADNGSVIGVSSTAAVSITVPAGLPAGFRCDIIQMGTGQIAYVGASGVALKNVSNLYKSNGQYSGNSLMTGDGSLFILGGDLTA